MKLLISVSTLGATCNMNHIYLFINSLRDEMGESPTDIGQSITSCRILPFSPRELGTDHTSCYLIQSSQLKRGCDLSPLISSPIYRPQGYWKNEFLQQVWVSKSYRTYLFLQVYCKKQWNIQENNNKALQQSIMLQFLIVRNPK